MLNALAISGFLGVKLGNFICYTAFRNDKISQITDPIELKTGVGKDVKENAYLEWKSGKIKFPVLFKDDIEHKKIQLNLTNGYGEITISLNQM